jgi:hypothetical protein
MSIDMNGWNTGQILVIDGNNEYYKDVFMMAALPYAIFMNLGYETDARPTWGVVDRQSRYIVRDGCITFAAAQREIALLMNTKQDNCQAVTVGDLVDEISERLPMVQNLPDRFMVMVDRLHRTLRIDATDFVPEEA